ncbi:zinc ribbon domain-containing protein [Sporobolomyces salmoneus]|uniref:zinc ribbon domain-containing protein n=1 Tax=Sporobolomyces salmoneus TaxID=183962 RepID=UPI0031826697
MQMSAISLVIGGIAGGLAWFGRTNGAGLTDWWSGWALALALCFLAYLTNPNPTSFRTHVTSLSFHTHLQRLSSASPTRSNSSASNSNKPTDLNATESASSGNLTASQPGNKRGKNGAVVTNGKTSNSTTTTTADSIALKHDKASYVVPFSNRISLAVRTPSYKFTSYHFFSTVYVPSSRPNAQSRSTASSPNRNSELNALLGLGGELWLGVFGRWYALKWWEGEENEQEERRGRLERGVRVVSVQDDLKDSRTQTAPNAPYTSSPLSQDPSIPSPRSGDVSSTPPQSPSSASASNPTSRSISVSKRIFRAGQRRSSPTSLTRLKSKAESAARERDEAAERAAANLERGSGNSGATPNSHDSPSSSALATQGKSDSKLSSPVQYDSTQTGKPPDPILVELQLQLTELRAQTRESEKRLRDELEVLRGKKKDEDTFRAELKTKTKGLEEAKRAADASRAEAERELNERKSVVKEVQKRVEKLRGEISKLEKKELEQVERKEKKKRDRQERERKLAEDVSKKKEELKEREQGHEEVLQKVNEMEKKLDVRRELLASRRNELAQLAGVVAARNGLGGPPSMYALPPQPPQPQQVTTATFGGVGAVANAFAVPFGHGAYGRRNYPYVHPLSATSSRPTSIRSGHYDPHTGTFQSAPSSPTLSHPVSPLDDPSAYPSSGAAAASNEQNGGWPSSYPAANSSSNSGATTLPQTGFLEHRLQHRATNSLPSADDIPSHFLPFDIDNSATQQAGDDGLRSLALPMQYLDSGLLAGSQSPGVDGPLSPMTPHQTSLIPSQLFHMLDDDDNDDFVMPDSPTLRSHFGSMSDWKGLGLDVDAPSMGSRRSSEETKQERKDELEAVEEETKDDEFHEAEGEVGAGGLADELQSSFMTLRPDLFHQPNGPHSATTSPLGPPPGSPFGPWDSTPSSSPAIASMPPPVPGENIGVIGSNILHRLSPSQDLTDDLPRAGLSLNPDAKAFAFPFVQQHQQQPHARTVSVPSIPGFGAPQLIRNGLSSSSLTNANGGGGGGGGGGTSSALPSPTSATYPSPISPPAKSRMEFANSSAPLSARYTPPFDWPRSTSSPKTTSATTTTLTGGDNASPGGFNPFDEEDSLLGPLK